MPDPSSGTRTRSDSLRSALRAFAPRVRTRTPTSPAIDTEQQPTPPQKDPAMPSPRRAGPAPSDTTAPAKTVRLVDDPLSGADRHYVIERELTSMAEVDAIVADYLTQAHMWDAIPAAGPCCLLADLQEQAR